jgi:nucleosome binding factor SPN SPT16 subunit
LLYTTCDIDNLALLVFEPSWLNPDWFIWISDAQIQRETKKLSANDSEHDKESNELHYYEDQDQLEEEQEEETGETTVNQFF